MSTIYSRFLYNIFNKIDKFAAVITLRKKIQFLLLKDNEGGTLEFVKIHCKLGKREIGNSLNCCVDVHVTV